MKLNSFKKESNKVDDGLLSLEGLAWLNSAEVSYNARSHEERMALIKAARILYPDNK